MFCQLTSILSMSSSDLASGSPSLSQIVESVTLHYNDSTQSTIMLQRKSQTLHIQPLHLFRKSSKTNKVG